MPPTPPSLGHNAIMLGLLEVVMLNVGSKCHGSCACNTRSMVQSNIVTQHLFTCLFPWPRSFPVRYIAFEIGFWLSSTFNWLAIWIECMVGWACWWKGPWKFQRGIHSANLSWIWHFATVSPFYGISRCTTRAKNDGFGNARRGPRCAGTATYFDSYQIL